MDQLWDFDIYSLEVGSIFNLQKKLFNLTELKVSACLQSKSMLFLKGSKCLGLQCWSLRKQEPASGISHLVDKEVRA